MDIHLGFSHIVAFLGGAGTFFSGLVPFLKWRDKHKKEEPEYAKKSEMSDLKNEVRTTLDRHGKIVGDAAIDVGNAALKVEKISEEIRVSNESSQKELREMLGTFDVGIKASLRECFDRSNEALTKTSKLEGSVETLKELLPKAG